MSGACAPVGEGHSADGAAVEAVLEGDDVRLVRHLPRQLDRSLDGLGAAAQQERSPQVSSAQSREGMRRAANLLLKK